MNVSDRLFLDALRASIHGDCCPSSEDREAWHGAVRLAYEHKVLPLLVEAVWSSPGGEELSRPHRDQAKRLTTAQAQRTADFLLLYDFLCSRGLHPAVLKGIVLRALYPQPEQRASVDEDLLIRPEDFPDCHRALLDYGLTPVNPDELDAFEVSYRDTEGGQYIELHKQLFPPDSDAYSDLNALFDGMLDRCETVSIYGHELMTLAPTDHLLYLICHAYKHFLHGGFGVRQVCDMGMFASRYDSEIDWTHIRQSCERVRVARFTAAVFRIAEHRLGFAMPAAFADMDVDESDLLEDILTGGLYGVNDINRAHSSTITLDAVARQKHGKKSAGALASVFLPLSGMKGKYPYLKRFPWLLPAAWVQRVWRYLIREGRTADPSASVRIGSDRVQLLREYGIVD